MKLAHASLLALILGAVSLQAAAVPIRATFDGAVSGSSGFFTNVLNDIPAGTTASFDVTFDDSGLLPAAPLTDYDLAPVSGWLRLGALEWTLDAGEIWTYSWLPQQGDAINYYGLQLTGSGPTIGGGAGSLFGLFLTLTADLEPYSSTSLSAGFRYPTGGGEFYSYADLAGTFSAARVTTSVPEPSTTLLMLPVLALLWRARRARAVIPPAATPTSTARSPA
jgi:hypothetical protein